MKGNNRILIAVFICILFNNCRSKNNAEVGENKIDNHLINANKILTHHESEDIEKYISSKGWEMIKTGTGLRYKINGLGKGTLINADQKVTITGKVLNMYGDSLIYSYSNETPILYVMGQAEQPKGVEEGLQLMKNGQSAIMILPSHLGFGLSGDGKSIPPRAVLVYQIEVLNVTNK